MLAQTSKLTGLMVAIAITLAGLFASAQTPQAPIQQYQPTAPPSVHVAPGNAKQLVTTAHRNGSGYRLSDHSNQFAGQPHPGAESSQIRRTSFVAQAGDPSVPAILAGATTPQAPAQAKPPVQQQNLVQLPLQQPFEMVPAPQAYQQPAPKNSSINVDPEGLNLQQQQLQEQVEFARQRLLEQRAALEEARLATEQAEAARLAAIELAAREAAARDAAEREAAARQVAELEAAARQAAAEEAAAQQAALEAAAQQAAAQEAAEAEARAAAFDYQQMQQFVDDVLTVEVAPEVPAQTVESSMQTIVAEQCETKCETEIATNAVPVSTPVQETQIPMLTAQPATPEPAQVAQVPAEMIPAPVNLVRRQAAPAEKPKEQPVVEQVSAESPVVDTPTAAINLGSPSVLVQTYGPTKIGINKTAQYKVTVSNRSNTVAERVLVGVNLPSWVDVQNVNLSNGQKEITDGTDQARLVWTVDHIPANATQTLTIDAVPRKAEMFDLGVEWTLIPRVGVANVTVTEPRLEMKISGPRDVMYGQKAIYHVTVRNPGTGDAENVKVKLPEALGGESAPLGNIAAGQEEEFQVELLARTAGELNLMATASADGQLSTSAERVIAVRRADLQIGVKGPGMKYAGAIGEYVMEIENLGDATATDVVAAVALPTGVKFLGGVDSVSEIDGGLRWSVGSLDPEERRQYKFQCQLDASGDLQIEVGARGAGDLAAAASCQTMVETIADLVLTVEDPKGPLPTGQDITYEIKIRNRGSRSARSCNLVMQFSEGIEPISADGLSHRIVPGQVLFAPIPTVDPGQELTYRVAANALKPGTHVFRAQLTCADSDAREIAEGTTRFFGDAVENQPEDTDTAENDFGSGLDR